MKHLKVEPDIWRFFFLPLLIMFILFMSTKNYFNSEIDEVTIKSKYSKEEFGKDTYYVIGENKQIYLIKNLLFKSNINEKELYESLEIGEKYEIYTTGYRIDEFNSYKIINKCISIKERKKLEEEENKLEIIKSDDGDFIMTPEMVEELSNNNNNKGED